MAEEPKKNSMVGRIASTPAHLQAIGVGVVIVVFVVGAFVLWKRFGAEVVGSNANRYVVALNGIETTPQPPWIDSDVKAEVFRNASWDQRPLSVLDPDATLRVAQAFELHTWVAKVTRVTKHHPARVIVQLEYRRPVAMVEVNFQNQAGLLPVDGEGVLLPPDDFSPKQAAIFPRIVADYNGPSGSIGTAWGDKRVVGAARIAAALESRWLELGLYRIIAVVPEDGAKHLEPTFELTTRGGARVLWGHGIGQEIPGESSGTQKVNWLLQVVQQKGSLEPAGQKQLIVDLRDSRRLSIREDEARLRTPAVKSSFPR